MKKTTQTNNLLEQKKYGKTSVEERLLSLDTLRGFDMFWIIGGGALLSSLANATGWNWLEVTAHFMHSHSQWEGFHFYDLIFPLFMFISGVAIPYALISLQEKGVDNNILFKKIFKRMVLLFLFGLVYNGITKNGFSEIRVLSVLSQIGIAYFFASLIMIHTSKISARLLWLTGILSAITVLQFLIPIPGFGAGVFTPEGSINAWIDQHFLPGRLIYKTYDPEGILSIVSATSITLMGALAGLLLRDKNYTQNRKTSILLISGVSLVLLALLLSPIYPIIKKIWTVPFNMLTSGISFLLLAIFYYIIDVKMWRGWILFFRVIGLNSITIYMGFRILDFPSEFFLGSIIKLAGSYGSSIEWFGVILLEWLMLYYFYKKKIFLRV